MRLTANLASLLENSATRFPKNIAIACGSGTITWAEFNSRVDALSAALVRRYEIKKGDTILVQSRNCVEMLETMFACFRVGAVFTAVNFRLTPMEVAYQARVSRAIGFMHGAEFFSHVESARLETEGLRFALSWAGGLENSGSDQYEEVLAHFAGEAVLPAAVNYDDLCWIMFTSGSTGRPKAATMTHGQMAFAINNQLCDLMPSMTADDASLVLAPLSHGAGVHFLVQVARGVKSVLPESGRVDPEEVFSLIARWKITNMFTVPTILKRLVDYEGLSRHDHSSLRYVVYAGAPMYDSDREKALRLLGPVLVQYYGLAEVAGTISFLPPEWHLESRTRSATAGFVRTGMDVEIHDEEGHKVEPGEVGEICVIGPAVFEGYFDDQLATEKCFKNGWFHTGDLGYLDSDGFLFITGRKSDMYISGGSNVYPREIEEQILAHPLVSEVAVVGVPDEEWGEIGIAVCVLKNEGDEASCPDLDAWLNGRIASYKKPRHYFFWKDLPKSGYGKVTKDLVRKAIVEMKLKGNS
ncbi:AMP-binding protein [Burkholderia sp. Bp9140]|uniref:AMP-binding protein n=1 Tax=Burkholderia sp. Bp9140 TaxID=2184572 RepID=UPI0021AB3B5D|nr:AMP-binding protein [Burkholderia sp. Bp9140]